MIDEIVDYMLLYFINRVFWYYKTSPVSFCKCFIGNIPNMYSHLMNCGSKTSAIITTPPIPPTSSTTTTPISNKTSLSDRQKHHNFMHFLNLWKNIKNAVHMPWLNTFTARFYMFAWSKNVKICGGWKMLEMELDNDFLVMLHAFLHLYPYIIETQWDILTGMLQKYWNIARYSQPVSPVGVVVHNR